MTTVERIKAICKSRRIPIYKLEMKCGFANGYIRNLQKGTMRYDRLEKVADALDVPITYLANGTESNKSQFEKEISEITSDFSYDEKQLLIEIAKIIKLISRK